MTNWRMANGGGDHQCISLLEQENENKEGNRCCTCPCEHCMFCPYLSSSFEHGILPAPQGVVRPSVQRATTIVAGKRDDRIIQPTVLLEEVHELTQPFIEVHQDLPLSSSKYDHRGNNVRTKHTAT